MNKRANDFQSALLAWYDRERRDLAWRVARNAPPGALPDPYHVLVSEAMLQQTTVTTVVGYFRQFVGTFPTLAILAEASEQQVLRLWQGLGYYSRARHLLRTAKIIQAEFGGKIPSNVEQLLTLPGIGRYTAGAIASLAFDQRAAILDGNVARVLCRLDCIRQDPRRPAVREKLWQRAAQILPAARCGDFNSALMELGATVCMPRSPKCAVCPLLSHCRAFAAGVQERIPRPAAAKARPLERRWTFCIQRGLRWLIEQRPGSGRWARLWQFVTLPAGRARLPTPADVLARAGVVVSDVRDMGLVSHDLTHRRYEFRVFRCCAVGKRALRPPPVATSPRVWVTLDGLSAYPLPRPHVRIAVMLQREGEASSAHRKS